MHSQMPGVCTVVRPSICFEWQHWNLSQTKSLFELARRSEGCDQQIKLEKLAEKRLWSVLVLDMTSQLRLAHCRFQTNFGRIQQVAEIREFNQIGDSFLTNVANDNNLFPQKIMG